MSAVLSRPSTVSDNATPTVDLLSCVSLAHPFTVDPSSLETRSLRDSFIVCNVSANSVNKTLYRQYVARRRTDMRVNYPRVIESFSICGPQKKNQTSAENLTAGIRRKQDSIGACNSLERIDPLNFLQNLMYSRTVVRSLAPSGPHYTEQLFKIPVLHVRQDGPHQRHGFVGRNVSYPFNDFCNGSATTFARHVISLVCTLNLR
jgi:hypothetical protein